MMSEARLRKNVNRLGRVLVTIAAVAIAGCAPADSPAPAEPAPAASAAAPVAAAERPKIVILGDSLTAGLGLEPSQSFPSLLQKHLDSEGLRYEVVNAGVSGDTTAGGLRRLDWSLQGNTRVLVVALGGNDGLRGLPVKDTRNNLEEIISRAKQRNVQVVLAGMEAPPNYGPAYTAEFRGTFRDLADDHDLTFIPFLLEGVAGDPALNQRDGIHPNPEGARRVEQLVWKALEPIVEGSSSR
jgi:acyl-CoA thioesterase I